MTDPLGVGLSYRRPFLSGLLTGSLPVDHVELLLEHSVDNEAPATSVVRLAGMYPSLLHSVSVSPCSTSYPLRGEAVKAANTLREAIDPAWIGDHMSYSGNETINAMQLLPPYRDDHTVATLKQNVRALRADSGLPVVIEYIAALDDPGGSLSETDVLTAACSAGAGLLLDIHNVVANRNNFGIDPQEVLEKLPLENVIQVHLAGGRWSNGRYVDSHDAPIDEEVWELYENLLERVKPRAVIIERDGNFPSDDELATDLRRARRSWERTNANDAEFPEDDGSGSTVIDENPLHIERLVNLVGPAATSEAALQRRGKTIRILRDVFPTALSGADELLDAHWQELSAAVAGAMTPIGQGRAAGSRLKALLPAEKRWTVDYDLAIKSLAYGEPGPRKVGPLAARTREGMSRIFLQRDEDGAIRIEHARETDE